VDEVRIDVERTRRISDEQAKFGPQRPGVALS
jgi:hypothetical protein